MPSVRRTGTEERPAKPPKDHPVWTMKSDRHFQAIHSVCPQEEQVVRAEGSTSNYTTRRSRVNAAMKGPILKAAVECGIRFFGVRAIHRRLRFFLRGPPPALLRQIPNRRNTLGFPRQGWL